MSKSEIIASIHIDLHEDDNGLQNKGSIDGSPDDLALLIMLCIKGIAEQVNIPVPDFVLPIYTKLLIGETDTEK